MDNKAQVAVIQLETTEQVEKNLEQAAAFIAAAAKSKAKLIVLPEMFPISGYLDNKLKIKEPQGLGPIQEFLAAEAKKHAVWIVGGTIPLSTEDNRRVKAACLVFNDRGELVGRYDKIHLFDVEVAEREYKESELIEAGDKIVVIETPFGRLGLAVCYDLRFPELFRCLANQNADLVAVPSAFTLETGKAHWEILCKSRAIENQVYLLAAAQTGGSSERKTYGHSMILSPWGDTLVALDSQEGFASAEIDLDLLRKIRANMPVKAHQRIFDTRSLEL